MIDENEEKMKKIFGEVEQSLMERVNKVVDEKLYERTQLLK